MGLNKTLDSQNLANSYFHIGIHTHMEETRLSSVADGFQELSDAKVCIEGSGYCWWYVGERMQDFEKILIRTKNGDSSVFDGYLITSELRYGHEISDEDFISHRPEGKNWDFEKSPGSKFFKVIGVHVGKIPIKSVLNAKTGLPLTNQQLRQNTHLLADFMSF